MHGDYSKSGAADALDNLSPLFPLSVPPRIAHIRERFLAGGGINPGTMHGNYSKSGAADAIQQAPATPQSPSDAFHPFPIYPGIPGLGDGNRGGSRRFRTRFLIRWNQNGILVPLAGTPQGFRWRGGADGTPDLGAFPRPPGGPFFSPGRRFAPPRL